MTDDFAQDFVLHLIQLSQNRAALAALRRSGGFAPGAYPPAFPYVERFVAGRHADDADRVAAYLVAMLFARHPQHQAGQSLARALAKLTQARQSASIEQRFITLLAADGIDDLPNYLRQAASLLAADKVGVDYAVLLPDLACWLHPRRIEARDRARQRWARDFYSPLPETQA